MPEHRWPADFAALRRGDGCPMCGGGPTRRRTDCGCSRAGGPTGTSAGTRFGPGTPLSSGRAGTSRSPASFSPEETAGFWSDVARVAQAVEAQYRPAKMNRLHLGNGVPHLHVHLVPRPHDDARAGHPLETEAFHLAGTPAVDPSDLAGQAAALRARLRP